MPIKKIKRKNGFWMTISMTTRSSVAIAAMPTDKKSENLVGRSNHGNRLATIGAENAQNMKMSAVLTRLGIEMEISDVGT